MTSRRLPVACALLAALLAAVVGLVYGWHGWPDCTTHLRDDAFYEFAWVDNLVHGRGPSVSDGVTTSGVQYLWCLLLCVPAWLSPASLPDAAVLLGMLCHLMAAASWVVHGGRRAGALVVGLLWLGNPLLLRECQNGQETALACLLLALLWQQRRAPAPVFATLAVLTMLARSDLFVVVALLSWWRHRPAPLRALPVPVLALAVHLALNRLCGGGWLQDSGTPMAWLFHANFERTEPALLDTLRQWWWYLRPVLLGGPFGTASAAGLGLAVFLLVRPIWPARWRALPALLVGIASAAGMGDVATPGWAALWLALFPAAAPRPWRRDLLLLFLGLLSLLLLHWALRWYPRDYYTAPLLVLAAAALLRIRRGWALLAVVAVVQTIDVRRVPLEPLGGQAEMELAALHLRALLPADERVGCFNAGLLAYWSRQNGPAPAVVNLDGVVDARSLAALQAQRLAAFLDEQRLRFVVDNAVQFATDPRLPHANGHWFGAGFDAARDLLEVARFDVPAHDAGRPGTDGFRLYWRRACGPPPSLPTIAQDLGRLPRGQRAVLWPAPAGAVLRLRRRDGSEVQLLTADAAIVHVVAIPDVAGALFDTTRAEPLLQLTQMEDG
ncbi:MAG: hypothetical protein IPK26_14600 [Planctomycetes bacterium]|nr:hypothetical protein [Planctomycetota bacterium]